MAALVRPALFAPRGQAPDRFCPALHVGRTIALGVAVAINVWLSLTDTLPAVLLLGVVALS